MTTTPGIEQTGATSKTGSQYHRPKQSRVSTWNRGRKWRKFDALMGPTAGTKTLDVGYSDREWSEGDNYLEKHYPWPHNLTALGIEEPTLFADRYPDVTVVKYPGDVFPFDDDSFDIVWSNATIEHVGGRADQVRFAAELARVGRRVFFTTPNRHFPIEVHTRTPFLHWLPKAWFDRYLHRTKNGWAAGDYMRLLSARELRSILAEAGVTNYKLIRNRVGPFTLDFVVVVG